jgi:plasmid stability protein
LHYGCAVITITIKGLSREAHQALKKRAETHGRSLNTEAIAVLESSVRSVPAETEDIIQRARQFRNSLKFRVTPADLKRFKERGRA